MVTKKSTKNNPNLASKSRSDILKFMKDTNITTTSEISGKLGLAWNTAEKRLLELTIDGKVTRIKKAGVNLWVLKK